MYFYFVCTRGSNFILLQSRSQLGEMKYCDLREYNKVVEHIIFISVGLSRRPRRVFVEVDPRY